MAITKTLSINESDGQGNLLTNVVVTSGIDNDLSTTVTSGAINQTATIAFVRTQLGLFYALAQTGTVTMYVNATSGGAPSTTITCVPGVPVLWYASNGYTITALFPADVTTIYLAGASTTSQFDIRVLKAG